MNYYDPLVRFNSLPTLRLKEAQFLLILTCDQILITTQRTEKPSGDNKAKR